MDTTSASSEELAEVQPPGSVKTSSNPLQKKLLECYLETETDWHSFNAIAETLLKSSTPDLDLLLLLLQGYQKQPSSRELQEKQEDIASQIREYPLTSPEEYVMLSRFYMDQLESSRAIQLLKKGLSLFPQQEDLLYTTIDIFLEANNYEAIVQILEPTLDHLEDPTVYLIYLKAIRLTTDTITHLDYQKYLPYFQMIKDIESQNADAYILQLSFLEDIPTAQVEFNTLLLDAMKSEIHSQVFFEQAVSRALHQCYLSSLQKALESCLPYAAEQFEQLFIQYIQTVSEEFKDFGCAAYLWNQFLERKNRVSKAFYLSCIDDAQERFKNNHKKNPNKEMQDTHSVVLKDFILASYQELRKLSPEDEYAIQKIAFLASLDSKAAEMEIRNRLQENPTLDALNKAMGDVLFDQKQYAQAVLYYQKIAFQNLTWEEVSSVKKRIFESLFYADMEEELVAFVQEMKTSNLPPYMLKVLAFEAFKKSVFYEFPEALEESKELALQALKDTKPDQELLLLVSTILQKQHKIPKALSIIDQNADPSHPLFSFKRAVLLYEMFQQTGHSKYLEDADYEMFTVELPKHFPTNLSSLVAESIIKPSSMNDTVTFPSKPTWTRAKAATFPGGRIMTVSSTTGSKIQSLTMKKKEGSGQLFCDSPYPYSIEKEWTIVKQWFDSSSILSNHSINSFDWFLTLDSIGPLPYEPAAFRLQLALSTLSCALEIDLSDLIVATYFSDIEGRVEPSDKTAFVLQSLARDSRFQDKSIVVPIGNLSDLILEYLKHPTRFRYWIATSSFQHLVEIILFDLKID
jgi:hypothetical protein